MLNYLKEKITKTGKKLKKKVSEITVADVSEKLYNCATETIKYGGIAIIKTSEILTEVKDISKDVYKSYKKRQEEKSQIFVEKEEEGYILVDRYVK